MSARTDRIEDVLAALTTAEKLALLHGSTPSADERAAGYLPAVERLDVGPIRMADGPLGVRLGEATAFPASIALGASFDVDLARQFGEAVGAEARSKGVDVLLAPGCNLIRVPHCGRTFEYYGEDPHHAARHTAATIEGIQSHDVAATVKHYVANNQERDRVSVSAEVGERALRELYLPPFEAAVDADVASVMAAYNRVNGTFATEHRELLTDVLAGEFGFEGPVMSDWWAVQDGEAAATGGLDLEMPGVGLLETMWMATGRGSLLLALDDQWPGGLPGPAEALQGLASRLGSSGGMPEITDSLFAEALPDALATGNLSQERLDDMVRRVLTLHDRVGALDGDRSRPDVDQAVHRELAGDLAVRGSVLLKNDGSVLPIDPDRPLALIGPNVDAAKLGGGGSSEVTPRTTVSPVEGVRDRANGRVVVERGHPPIEESSMFEVGPDLGGFLGREGGSTSRTADAEIAAASTDVAVVVVQDDATEARDRESLALPGEQDRLVSAVADAAARTVVVLQTAGPVEMPWLEEVDAVLETWYPGQEAGDALASVLFGDADPGGRLPVTFAEAAGDYPANATARYPGVVGTNGYREARYDEGVFVGYRHFDARDVAPAFPFGHGLSYAEFAYGDLEVALEAGGRPASVQVSVENTADRHGREVVQVYVSPPESSVPRPPRELVGFASVDLDAGAERTVDVSIDGRAFAYYDEDEGDWVHESGEYGIEVGRSSRDVSVRETVSVD